jgi:hypothetical protein
MKNSTAERIAPGHLRKGHGQSLEDQSRTGRRIEAVVEHRGENHQTGKQRHARIRDNDNQHGLRDGDIAGR